MDKSIRGNPDFLIKTYFYVDGQKFFPAYGISIQRKTIIVKKLSAENGQAGAGDGQEYGNSFIYGDFFLKENGRQDKDEY